MTMFAALAGLSRAERQARVAVLTGRMRALIDKALALRAKVSALQMVAAQREEIVRLNG
jgi:hypothetical protein